MDDPKDYNGSIDSKVLVRLDPAPKGGEGFNLWLPHAAGVLCNNGVPEDTAREYLFRQQMDARGGREDREVERVLELAYHPNEQRKQRATGKKSTRVKPGQTEPPEPDAWGNLARPNEEVDQKMQAAAIAAERTTALEWLCRFPDRLMFVDAREAMRLLMGDDPSTLVCVGRTVETARTLSLEPAMKSAGDCGFIVPSLMTAPTGTTKDGKDSPRSLDNTGPRRYLVIESDSLKSKDDQASVLMFLSRFAPLCAVVDSGGKSLHGWFYCLGQSERDLWRFMRIAVRLGADPAPWSRCQMVRMPEGLRDNGNRQSLRYFDSSKIGSEEWHIKGLLKWEAPFRITENDSESAEGSDELPRSEGFKLIHVDEFGVAQSNDFVEGLLTVQGVSLVYGPSGAAKTFFGCDLAAHIATSRSWCGREVDGGAVVYVTLEGRIGFKNRIAALKHKGLLPEGAPFFAVFDSVSLLTPGHADKLASSVKEAAEKAGMPVRFVVLDTMSRAMAGGDENSPNDMTAAVQAIDAIKEETGAHVCVIHHSGKDQARGARGHSSLRAAVDTEIELTRDEKSKITRVKITKQRDLETGPPSAFSLQPVMLGLDRRGKPITSCVVTHLTPDQIPRRTRRVGRRPKHEPANILALLPQPSKAAWKKVCDEELGCAKTTFYDLVGPLEEQGRVRRNPDGSLEARADDTFEL